MIYRTLLASMMLVAPAYADGITGADLLVDLDKYIGQSVRLNDGHISMAQNDGAVVTSRGATFRISSQGIDRETFRYILSNCSGIMTGPACNLSLIVTPTTGKYADWPILINVSRTEPPPA